MRAPGLGGLGLPGRVAALVAAAAGWTVGVAGAQETAAPAPSPPPAWRQVEPSGAEPGTFWFRMPGPELPARARIGVFLRTECPDVAAGCEEAPVVASVVPGGPADRAGVRPGEQLLSLDDIPLASPEGQAALGELRDGEEVRLAVQGRDGARRTVRLTPELREPAGLAFFEGSDPTWAGGHAEVRVYRLPGPEGREQLEVRLDSLRSSGSAFVVVTPDARGSLRIEVAGEEVATVLRDAPPRGAAPSAPGSIAAPSGESGSAPSPTVGYLVESPELARSLTRAREAALRSARVRLDSLVRLRKEMPGPLVFMPAPRPEGPPAAGRERVEGRATWTLRSADPEVDLLLAANARIAGAEFRPLTKELAEYFQGTESGLLVLRVIPGTPAERLGLRGGDVVLEAAGRPVDAVDELRAVLEGGHGVPVNVKWIRKGIVTEGRLELP